MGLGADLNAIEDKLNSYEGKIKQIQQDAARFDQEIQDLFNRDDWDGKAADRALGSVLPGGQEKIHSMLVEFNDLAGDWRSILGTLSDLVQIASAAVDAASDAIDEIEGLFS
jgi:hypothetical protein